MFAAMVRSSSPMILQRLESIAIRSQYKVIRNGRQSGEIQHCPADIRFSTAAGDDNL
jgi:hypothetical protein